MKFAQKRLVHREGKRDRADAAALEAQRAGLLPCGHEVSLFRAIGVGEERPTSFLPGVGGSKPRIRSQWWAPADLVRFNRVLIEQGVSSKIRRRVLLCRIEGKELPEKAHEALASYTESLLARR